MKKQYIEFKTEHQQITRTDDFFVVGGSKNYLHARFCFCDDWADEQVTAVFSAGGNSYTKLVVDGECCVPWEVLQHKTFFVGCMAGSLITSNAAEVKVCPCGVQPGIPSSPPSPSAYEQMVSIMEETKLIVQSVREDADNGVFNGAPGPKGDPGADGKDGKDGKDGTDGYTPQKGVDYYTESDKTALVEEITLAVTGDIETALDSIIAIQNELIGGDGV